MKPNRWIVSATYLIGVLLIASPVTQLVLQLWPLRPSDVAWRFGAGGLATGTLLTPLVGFLVVIAIASVAQHRSVLRTLSVLAGAAAVALLPIMGLFALDAVQVRERVLPAGLRPYDLAAASALVQLGAISAICAMLSIGIWKLTRRSVTARAVTGTTASVPDLLVASRRG